MLARVLLIWIGIVLPCSALAVDVNVSVNGTAVYDTNIGRSSSNENDDIAFRFGTTIRAQDTIRKLRYNVRYTPTYRKSINSNSANDGDHLSHNAGGTVSYLLGNKTSLSLTENFSFTQSITQNSLAGREDSTGTPVAGEPETETGSGEILRNRLVFQALHRFTPRLSSHFSVSHDYFDSDTNNTSQSSSLIGTTGLTYDVGARDKIGFGGAINWQQFEGVRGQPGSDTNTYRVFASWVHNFGENTELSIRGGPALISTRQDRPSGAPDEFKFLFVDIGSDVETVGDLNLQGRVATDLDGNELADTDTIAPASILVPDPVQILTGPNPKDPKGDPLLEINPNACSFGRGGASVGVISGDCFFTRLVQPVDMDSRALIESIRTEPVSFTAVNPKTTNDSTLTFFGQLSLSHQWAATVLSKISYTRSDSSSSSLGSSTVADHVTFVTRWNPTGKLNLSLRADWLQRKSANEITNTFREVNFENEDLGETLIAFNGNLVSEKTDRSVDTSYWSISARAGYQLTRRLSMTTRLTYQKQDTKKASTTSSSNFGDVIAFVGLSYAFDPFHF